MKVKSLVRIIKDYRPKYIGKLAIVEKILNGVKIKNEYTENLLYFDDSELEVIEDIQCSNCKHYIPWCGDQNYCSNLKIDQIINHPTNNQLVPPPNFYCCYHELEQKEY